MKTTTFGVSCLRQNKDNLNWMKNLDQYVLNRGRSMRYSIQKTYGNYLLLGKTVGRGVALRARSGPAVK